MAAGHIWAQNVHGGHCQSMTALFSASVLVLFVCLVLFIFSWGLQNNTVFCYRTKGCDYEHELCEVSSTCPEATQRTVGLLAP